MRYLRRTSNYLKRITVSDLAYMMSMTDLITLSVETLMIHSGSSLKKEFTKLIRINS